MGIADIRQNASSSNSTGELLRIDRMRLLRLVEMPILMSPAPARKYISDLLSSVMLLRRKRACGGSGNVVREWSAVSGLFVISSHSILHRMDEKPPFFALAVRLHREGRGIVTLTAHGPKSAEIRQFSPLFAIVIGLPRTGLVREWT